MPAPAPDARSQLAEVTSIEPCGSDTVLLTVRPEEPVGRVAGGRFFMLRREDRSSPAIPRPFSLYRQVGDRLVFMIQVLGEGTQALAACGAGVELRLIGPLGEGWPELPVDGPPLVMLAGGVGAAPFHACISDWLERAGARGGSAPTMIFGAASADRLYDFEGFEALGVPLLAATDDGSRGFPGNVIACLEEEWRTARIPRQVQLLACGPDPMLKAVECLARERGLPCWVSLETLMGCGVGICNGCVVSTRDDGPMAEWPYAKCCTDGPVFSTETIRLAD